MKPPLESRRPISDPKVLERMRIALDLYQVAEDIQRQNLRRRNPDATEEEIQQGIREWLAEQSPIDERVFRRRTKEIPER